MEQLQRRESVRKQHLELMSMVKLRYCPQAFEDLMVLQRNIKLKREREIIFQAQRRKDVVMYCLLAVVLAIGIWAIWGMVATAIEWKQNGI